jgi:demethylmenaquinone methyltransferase/2-methoxy-6-polyprenyl-1,4-benzoquinol methylase
LIKPYNNDTSKKDEVRAMFNSIARNYDFLNHFLSFGIDVLWRKRLIRELKKYKPLKILDIATGTADLAIMASKINDAEIVGVDLSSGMIEVGKEKVDRKNLNQKIQLLVGDAESLDLKLNSFDAAMVAFGVRNFEDLDKGLTEIAAVLKDESPLFVLEFSKPQLFLFKQLYHFYSFKILPLIGKVISKDSSAYIYLPASINEFHSGKDFIQVMERCGFSDCRMIPLSLRIATIYIGHKNIG